MLKNLKNRIAWLRNSGVTQTIIGFVSFLIIAAVIMLFFEASEGESGIKNLFSSLWFAIVTITTVGYGDLSPVSVLGKLAAVVIMFIGVLYIGVLTGNITSWLVERNRRRVFGLVPVRKKEGHFLILGWRPGMGDLLKDILQLHQEDSDFLVLVNTADAKEVIELRQDPELKGIGFYSGDYTSKEVLKNACADTASKVLVISGQEHGFTTDEIDFRSVLAAIAIKRLNPQVYTIVEIVQYKFNLYLQHVEVEEIILKQDSSRALISHIALMSGLNNVFTKFFSMNDQLLKIKPVEGRMVGKSYADLKSMHHRWFILGLVENSGNLRTIKNEKMKAVQRSVSIQKAINDINELKQLRSNVPIFHPPPNYLIKENSGVIVLDLEGRDFIAPELSKQTIVSMASPATLPDEKTLRRQIERTLVAAKSWNELLEGLRSAQIEFYQYGNKINGVIYKNRKYPFLALGISPEKEQIINKLFAKKGMSKPAIKAKFEKLMNLSLDWDEFFERLRREGFEFYTYRNRVNGIRFEDKRFSFKTLELDSEIVDEIQRIKSAKTESKAEALEKRSHQEHIGLAELINDLKRRKITISSQKDEEQHNLIICGWKPQLPEMVAFIVSQYHCHETDWNRIAVVADIDDANIELWNRKFSVNGNIKIFQGSIVDRELLKQAGIAQATKVILLAETESGKTNQEIDSQTVLAAMMISSLNKKAYKVAEILDKRYKESLEQANVEEIYLDDEFTRIMLSNGSHGVGVTRVIREMINSRSTVLSTKRIDPGYIHGNFGKLVSEQSHPGELIIGLLEETGNINVRKAERIHQAKIQSNIKGQVEELIKVKEFEPNRVVLAPASNYVVLPNSKLISMSSSDPHGWNHFQNMIG